MNRREFLISSAVVGAAAYVSSAAPAPTPATTTAVKIPDDVVWHDVREWGIEGRGFNDTEQYFDRLPARAKDAVRPEVWSLARNSAGMSVLFEALTPSLYVRYELTSDRMAMPHMPATGVSGVDLYTKFNGKPHWLATVKPVEQKVVAALVNEMPAERRVYTLNLPLYNGVKTLEIGVPKGARFVPVAPRKEKPVLIYGTSITQGGCASRPGLAWPAILGRKLDRPMLNFGFSGNGKMEVEVARFLAEIDPAIFVLDCLANMGKVAVTPSTIAVVKVLREARPKTPILILGEHPWDDNYLLPQRAENHAQRSRDYKVAYEELVAEGVTNLHYRDGEDLNGSDGESTVDGNHPNDLGMMRHAEALEADFRKLLG
jgi:lysophospholipase L1-like esterase